MTADAETSERIELASLIERFVHDDVGPYDWDDGLAGSRLREIKDFCWDASNLFPSAEGHYSSEEGRRALQDLATALKTSLKDAEILIEKVYESKGISRKGNHGATQDLGSK